MDPECSAATSLATTTCATSTKTRGAGIGFAGVGIKLGLLVCEEVITETRRGKTHCATTWSLSSRHKASWKWLPSQPGLVPERGTAVRLRLTNPLSPLLDAGFVEAAMRRHFEPLLDPTLDEMLGLSIAMPSSSRSTATLSAVRPDAVPSGHSFRCA